MEVMLAQFLSFAAVLMLVFGIRSAIRPREPDKNSRPGIFGFFQGPVSEIGRVLESPYAVAFPSQVRRIHGFLLAASLQDRMTVRDVLGMQGLLGAGCFAVALVGVFTVTLRADVAIVAAFVLGLVGWMYPTLWLGRAAAIRQEAVSQALPYAIDLLTVAMQAGQDFGAAVRFLVREGPHGPLRDEFSVMLQETEFGKTRIDALRTMAARIQLEEVGTLVTAVAQSTEMGSSMTDTLRIQAEEIRRARFHKAERKAARAPSLMMIPVALFILPAVFIIILTPVILRMTHTLHGVR